MYKDKFCKRCYTRVLKEFAERRKTNPKINLDTSSLIFRCKNPVLFYDPYGNAKVRVYNCEKNVYDIYNLKDYEKKFGGL